MVLDSLNEIAVTEIKTYNRANYGTDAEIYETYEVIKESKC